MKIAKFMFKFNIQMLPDIFNNYFKKFDNVYNFNTRQKTELNFSNMLLNQEKLFSSYRFKGVENRPKKFRHSLFPTFKKYLKNILLIYECFEIV